MKKQFDSIFRSDRRSASRRRDSFHLKLRVEPLEGRLLLATDILNSGTYGPGPHTFRITDIDPGVSNNGKVNIASSANTVKLNGTITPPSPPKPDSHDVLKAYVGAGLIPIGNSPPNPSQILATSLVSFTENQYRFSFDVPVSSGINNVSYKLSHTQVFTDGRPDVTVYASPTITTGTVTSALTGVIDVNHIPDATAQSRSVAHGSKLNFSIGDVATDTDRSDSLSFSQSGFVAPMHGTVKFIPTASSPTSLEYTPDPSYIGDDFFYYSVTDNYSTSTQQKISIRVTDAPPELERNSLQIPVGMRSATINRDSLLVTDVELDANSSPSKIVYTITKAPSFGEVVRNGSVLGVNGTFTQDEINKGIITYNHLQPINTSDSLGFTYSDDRPTDDGHTRNGTLSIRVGKGIQLPIISGFPLNPGSTFSPNKNSRPSFRITNVPTNDVTIVQVKTEIPGQGLQVVATASPSAINPDGSWTATATTTLPDGEYTFFATTTIRADESDPGPDFPTTGTIRIDTVPPAFVKVAAIRDDTGTPGDFITKDQTPTFHIEVGADHPKSKITVTLARAGQGQVLAQAETTSNGTVDLAYTGTPLAGGTYDFDVVATDDAGNSVKTKVTVVIDPDAPVVNKLALVNKDSRFTSTNPVTLSAAPTIAFTIADQAFRQAVNTVSITITDGANGPVLVQDQWNPVQGAASKSLTYTLPALSQGNHDLVVNAVDTAGNRMTPKTLRVYVNPTGAASLGTTTAPVYQTVFDLSDLKVHFDQPLNSGDTSPLEFPWSQAFDRTTQTAWVALRGGDDVSGNTGGGNRVIQIDPATRAYRVYDLQDPEIEQQARTKLTPLPDGPANRLSASGPHGIAFDFESHLTPRVWFTQERGKLFSYIDIERNELVVYDLHKIFEAAKAQGVDIDVEHADPHAVAVDRRGVVWITDQHEQRIYEFDTRGGSSIDASTGTLIVHEIPPELRVDSSTFDSYRPNSDPSSIMGPHGIDVVVDDKTNQATVYVTMLGTGRVLRLVSGLSASGADTAGDVWTEFSLGSGDKGLPLFVAIDTNETPNTPGDDRIFYADPGYIGGATNGFIRMLDLKAQTLTTWEIPALPGGDRGAQPNQAYVDREGHVFFIDRSYGVSRLDPKTTLEGGSPIAPSTTVAFKTTSVPNMPTVVGSAAPVTLDFPSIPWHPLTLVANEPGRAVANQSLTFGLDQYGLTGPGSSTGGGTGGGSGGGGGGGGGAGGAGGRGQGPFRGTFNAGNVLFGSLTQNDSFSTSVFADSARRAMSAVYDPGTANAPGVARQAFQVQRTGHIILTRRLGDALRDEQVDLTALVNGPLIDGDVSAVTDSAGLVHAFGRDRQTGGAAEYLYNPTSRTWTASRLSPPAGTTLGGNPSSFLDSVRGAGVMFTTNNGHLVVYYPASSADPVDLTALAGASSALVYSTVGVAQAGDRIYAYGTDQTGSLLEFSYAVSAGPRSIQSSDVWKVVDASQPAYRKANDKDHPIFLQNVTVAVDGQTRHVFGGDGASRLVHVAVGPGRTVLSRENVTTQLTPDRVTGYSAYQLPFAGRIYSDASAVIDPATGDLYVYGTNGRDLIQFHKPASGPWEAANLTNNVGRNLATGPANRVFGAPFAYILPDGSKHVLQINEDGEVVEYYQLGRSAPFSTTNITLSQNSGNTSPDQPVAPPPVTPTDQPHPTRIGPKALQLTPNADGSAFVGQGLIQSPRDRLAFQFRPTRAGRATITLQTPPNTFLRFTVFNRWGRRIAVGNTSAAVKVAAGKTYYVLVQGTKVRGFARNPNAGFGFGAFSLLVRS